jgi:hypothetical protein
VTSPPATTGENTGPSPPSPITLPRATYDLRAADGHLICPVSRERAAAGIAAGELMLRTDRRGEYLAAVDLAYPPEARRSERSHSLHPLQGDPASKAYRGVVNEVEVKTGAPAESLRTFAPYPVPDQRTPGGGAVVDGAGPPMKTQR